MPENRLAVLSLICAAVFWSTSEPLINPMWVFLAIGEAPGKWAFIGGTLVLAAVTVRGVTMAGAGRVSIAPAEPSLSAQIS